MADIYHDIHIGASASEVFDCITTPRHLEQWWPLKCSGKRELGAKYNFYFEEPYNWWGEVVNIESEKSFHIKMTDADKDWDPTTFGFDLRPADNGVWVEFWHKEWAQVNHHFRRSSHCWALLLVGLKKYIEEGMIIPFVDRS